MAHEVFGIAKGLSPHPDDLNLTLCRVGREEIGEEGGASGPVIPEYPPDE